jgi:hypothetical protein
MPGQLLDIDAQQSGDGPGRGAGDAESHRGQLHRFPRRADPGQERLDGEQ